MPMRQFTAELLRDSRNWLALFFGVLGDKLLFSLFESKFFGMGSYDQTERLGQVLAKFHLILLCDIFRK